MNALSDFNFKSGTIFQELAFDLLTNVFWIDDKKFFVKQNIILYKLSTQLNYSNFNLHGFEIYINLDKEHIFSRNISCLSKDNK